MSDPQKVSAAELESYLARINTGSVPEVIKVYQELQDKGYGYAGWAKGVATAETVTGLAPIDYLTGSALIGLGGEECRYLSEAQIDAIRVDMADGYVRALLAKANQADNNGFVNSDVDFRNTEAFHQEEFVRNGLTNDNWTLQIPMELIRKTEGDAAAEAYWVRLRDTGGEGPDALLESLKLYAKIEKLANGSDPVIAAQAGVQEVNLAYTEAGTNPDEHGNERQQTGSYTTTAGTTRAVHDVWFTTDNRKTIYQRIPIELSSPQGDSIDQLLARANWNWGATGNDTLHLPSKKAMCKMQKNSLKTIEFI